MNIKQLIFASAITLTATACATGTPPKSELATAETYVKTAQDEQADKLAAEHYRRAKSNLDIAMAALDSEDYQQARWAAEKATADAKLAEAKAKTVKMQKMLTELNETIAQLEQEMHAH
ncbi:DUF4398 domain-containing protein [Simiduia sp. 21SJ11W-1]|uniref:DUF4398 domain-containing protein n=1 Tax=Simiduia sp. 21SJ11W-1 TaxID=2909669 RepID=UPI00209ED37F|nr:DUF4398 domain-containing protein [Simiduia sp. 21SJ11W-1]UTA48518.1 DUF4398 domain-containing protein [Simiduia sp. 21SJ11W-1]